MAGENSGDTVNIIALGADTAPLDAALKHSLSQMRIYQYELAKLERAGGGESSRADNLRRLIAVENNAAESTRKRIQVIRAGSEANEAFAKSSARASEATDKLASSLKAAAAASASANEAMRAKLLNERAEAAKKAAEWEDKLSASVARASAASAAANEAMRAKLLNERAEAARKAAEWEDKLSASVARASAASAAANEAARTKLLNERAEAAKKAAAQQDLLLRGSALGIPILSRLSDRARQGVTDLGALSTRLTGVGGAARSTAGHTHAAALAHDALHSAARGVSGVMGGLWLTYARMLPVLLGVAAATKLVKDSIGGGLDVGFATQFAAILQTENMLGRGQSDAYNNLATLRDDIRKSLIDISRESVFTVEQNAQALQKLSLAGVNAQKGLELLTTASNVAVLAQVDLGKATTMVLDTLYNFGMASESSITMAENYAKASDIMAFTANTVNASFEDIARSFENITGVAGTFNVTIEEASALLQSLAKTGIRGPKAGTYVRNFMDDLLGAPISQRAEKELGNLNIDRYNADLYGEGDFGAAKYIDELVESLSKLGFVEQQNAIRAITNQRSRRVLRQELIEYRNGLKEVNGELVQTNSLYERTVKLQADAQGSLARMAEGLTGDTKYQFIMAQSAYNAAVNEAYLPAEPALRGAAQSLQALFRSAEFREMVTGLVTGFASLAKGAAEFAVTAMSLTKYLDGLGDTLATIAKYATALGGAFLAIKGYAAVSATIAGLGGAAAAAAAGVRLLNVALLANPAVAVGVALVATLAYLDQWNERSKKYEKSLEGRQAKLEALRKTEAEYEAQVERKKSGDRGWFDSLFPEKKLEETRAEIKEIVDGIAADMNSAMDSVSFQNSFDKILNETDTFLTDMRNSARQAGGDFETEYRNKLVRSIEDAQETLSAYANTVNNLDKNTEGGKQFAAFMTAWLSGISERAMIAGEELGRLNLVLSNQSLKASAEGLEFGVKDLSQLEAANEELQKSVRALELGEEGLFLYRQEQKKTQLASLENAYAALEFSYAMAAAANAPLATLEQMQAQMVATAINMSRLTDNIALSERERALQPPKRGARPDRDPVRAQLEEARTAIQDFKNSYSEMLGSIQDSTKDLAIGPLEAYEKSMRAAAEAYDQMFAAIYKAKNTSGLSATDRQKLQTDENKLIGEANKETKRLVEEYRAILESRSKGLEELEIATGQKVLTAAESWLREYASKYGETVTQLQNDIANLETKLRVAVDTGQSAEEVARLTAELAVLRAQLSAFGKNATLGAWAEDIKESLGLVSKEIDAAVSMLDRLSDKVSDQGLFGILMGNTATFNAARDQAVRGIDEKIRAIRQKIAEANQNGDLKLEAALTLDLQKAEEEALELSERIHPILESWGDSLGDYIANGIVYGFDQGESPAKAFANFLKREIYLALAQALSQQFKLSLSAGLGGGYAPARPGGSSGGFGMPPGLGSTSLVSNGLQWAGSALGSASLGSFGFGMTATSSQIAGLSGAGLINGSAATAGSYFAAAMPYVGVALFAAQALGLFDKKPSDKSAWAHYDPKTGKAFDIGSMTGKKDPGQDVRDATAAAAMMLGSFSGMTGNDSKLSLMTGARDGIRLHLYEGFRSPEGGVYDTYDGTPIRANYGTDMAEALPKMLNDLIDEGTLPQETIDRWRALQTNVDGSARDAVELVDTLALINQGLSDTEILRADLIQAEGETLGQAATRLRDLQSMFDPLTADEAWTKATTDLADAFTEAGVAMPATKAAFLDVMNSIDLTTEAGQDAYRAMTSLAPAFYDLATAVEEVMASISSVTADSIEDIRLSVLDDEGKYAYYDQKLVKLDADLKKATSPAEIDRIVKETNSTALAAWNLLDEDEQKRLAPGFITRLEGTEDLAGTRLQVIPLEYGANPMIGLEQQELTRAQTEAATAQGQAAADLSVAAKTFSDLMVRLMPRQEVGAEGLISAGNALTAAANALSSAARSTNSEVGY